MPDEVTMTLKEAAAFLRKHPNTLARLTKAGKVPGKKVGDEFRYLKSALIEWLAQPPTRAEEYAETSNGG